ncbi:MarR family transcriptional regulator [Roseomonas aeriglobus]|nr:MarR family transcriptional regulator [Roseomonas aeriglobus]
MTQISTLDSHLGFWLRQVSNHVSHRFAARLAEQGVTPAEWVLLRMLHDAGAVPPSALAERLGFTRGAITKLVDRLRAKRLVVRAGAGGADRRYQTIALTGAGAVLVPKLAAIADANDAETFGHLTAAERTTLDRLLRALVDRARIGAIPVE